MIDVRGLCIYNASAGSGKTFHLVLEYIDLLLENPQNYKNILAVTFTNASTREMKDRIVEVLTAMVEDADSKKAKDYVKNLLERHPEYTKEDIQHRAHRALSSLLHNYSFFNICTIDSFFQMVLKNMAKELGIGTGFNIVLKDDDYNLKAVKNVLAKSKQDPTLDNWLKNYFYKRVEDNERWNFEKDLTQIISQRQKAIVNNNIHLLDIDKLEQIRKTVLELKSKVLAKEDEFRNAFFNICGENRPNEDSFSRGILYNNIVNRTGKEFWEQTPKNLANTFEVILYKLKSGTPLLKKVKKEYPENPAAFEILVESIVLAQRTLNTLDVYERCIYPIGVLKYIDNERASLLKEDESFLLGETKYVLQNMLQTDDISFVYEKIGAYINHIMIDEFQDTSHPDWHNLKLLINECVANGGKAFIFGDTKQSIYRWNDGDAGIMSSEIDKARGTDKVNEERPLKYNFRTYENIIRFNNALFSSLYDATATQQPGSEDQKDKGSVRVWMYPYKSSGSERIERIDVIEKTREEIEFYRSLGYKNKDIALLFSSNNDLDEMAKALKELDEQEPDISKHYNPVSDRAFRFASSSSVEKIICALKFMQKPKSANISKEYLDSFNPMNTEKLLKLKADAKNHTSLLETIFSIARVLELEEDTVFLPAFYDRVKSFASRKASSIKDFLLYWDEVLAESSVEMVAGEDCIRLTSIHKSKGLEYDIVIIPQCDWVLEKSNEIIWLANTDKEDAIIKEMPLLQASVSKLAKTIYYKEGEEERKQEEIDNINKLYVALTRPKKHLSLIMGLPLDKDYNVNVEKSVAKYIYKYILSTSFKAFFSPTDTDPLLYLYNGQDAIYYPPKKASNTAEEKENSLIKIEDIAFEDNVLSYSASKTAAEYFFSTSKDDVADKRLLGTRLHNIMAEIKCEQDIEKQEETLQDILSAMMEYAREYHWFDGSYQVMNEKNIAFYEKDMNNHTSLKEKRPDRLMIAEDEAVIVDYKFAEIDSSLQEREAQVRQYRDLLQQMGYKNISCYLWYVEVDEENFTIQQQKLHKVI